ncbi:hypothetical protein OH77DRAFT_1568391 [Trametes cingulata]|nr:hypothetical protein OH77DRAFT_1568391 [Trametes cingulata]
MARFCNLCRRNFPTQRGYMQHNSSYHRHPKPRVAPTTVHYHPLLNARPCDEHGNFLEDPNAAPPLRDDLEDYEPFEDRPSFEAAELLIEKMAASQGDIEQLLRIMHAKSILNGHDPDTDPLFHSPQHLFAAIDSIKCGDTQWQAFSFRYAGPITPDAPKWKRQSYVVYARNTLEVLENMASSADFDGSWHTRPYQQFDENGTRQFSDLLSGHWAWKQADAISEDPATHGSMFTPIAIAADKTTALVATGNQEFHPVYMMAGNVTNEMRRAHRDAVVPVAFLPIPKAEAEYANNNEFRLFKKQIYHQALRLVFNPLRPGMTRPHVLRCPDGHYRRAIFGIGPVIADYPEQVYLSGIVQGWCPKCLARHDRLDELGDPRFREHTCQLWDTHGPGTLWDDYGVVDDVTPFTYYFPRADIHELLAPDLLHQLVKGTFKDHLVSWVEEYIRLSAPSEREAKRILDDIDRRIAASPSFPGLRRFPNGRNFKQWTGNDSKALMKVFLPALTGYVPDQMVQCLAAFLDFAYLARRPAHDMRTLDAMDAVLARFRELREIFIDTEVRPDGFSLPRQHALFHYTWMIKLFGSPNGVCTSISESRHITAVKRPWRASNRNKPLFQILRTNTRLSKLAALRAEFGRRGMLQGDVVAYALSKVGLAPPHDEQQQREERYTAEQEVADVNGPQVQSHVYLSSRCVRSAEISTIAQALRVPNLHKLMRRFLREQLFPELDEPGEVIPLDICPWIPRSTRVSIHSSATAVFFAPSELCGPGGMHSEIIRCTSRWRNEGVRRDTVFVQLSDDPGMDGMAVGRVRAFLSFVYGVARYECAVLEWFERVSDEPDPVTGMWVVKPEVQRGHPVLGIVSVDAIVRSCHLIGVYGRTQIPTGFHFTHSLDAFRRFYVNPYADYHIHELLK